MNDLAHRIVAAIMDQIESDRGVLRNRLIERVEGLLPSRWQAVPNDDTASFMMDYSNPSPWLKDVVTLTTGMKVWPGHFPPDEWCSSYDHVTRTYEFRRRQSEKEGQI